MSEEALHSYPEFSFGAVGSKKDGGGGEGGGRATPPLSLL